MIMVGVEGGGALEGFDHKVQITKLGKWEAYSRGSLPLHNLVSDSANPHCVSDPLPQPLWDHASTGQL